jgi:hypothetical protein
MINSYICTFTHTFVTVCTYLSKNSSAHYLSIYLSKGNQIQILSIYPSQKRNQIQITSIYPFKTIKFKFYPSTHPKREIKFKLYPSTHLTKEIKFKFYPPSHPKTKIKFKFYPSTHKKEPTSIKPDVTSIRKLGLLLYLHNVISAASYWFHIKCSFPINRKRVVLTCLFQLQICSNYTESIWCLRYMLMIRANSCLLQSLSWKTLHVPWTGSLSIRS